MRRCYLDGCERTPTVELLDGEPRRYACAWHVELLAKGKTIRFKPLPLSKRPELESFASLLDDAPQAP